MRKISIVVGVFGMVAKYLVKRLGKIREIIEILQTKSLLRLARILGEVLGS